MSILYYSQPKNDFSDLYIKVRKKENRLYSENEIKKLPCVEPNNPHYKKWQIREKSTTRFVNY